MQAIENSRLHVTPRFHCNGSGQEKQLLEVRLRVCKNGTEFRDCTFGTGQCDTSRIRFPKWDKITKRPNAVEENFRIALSAP